MADTTRSSTESPSGVVTMRWVKPVPALTDDVQTMLPATSRSFALVVSAARCR